MTMDRNQIWFRNAWLDHDHILRTYDVNNNKTSETKQNWDTAHSVMDGL